MATRRATNRGQQAPAKKAPSRPKAKAPVKPGPTPKERAAAREAIERQEAVDAPETTMYMGTRMATLHFEADGFDEAEKFANEEFVKLYINDAGFEFTLSFDGSNAWEGIYTAVAHNLVAE